MITIIYLVASLAVVRFVGRPSRDDLGLAATVAVFALFAGTLWARGDGSGEVFVVVVGCTAVLSAVDLPQPWATIVALSVVPALVYWRCDARPEEQGERRR